MTLEADKESLGDYTESQLYDMITDIYSYVSEAVVRMSCTNDEYRVLFLDLDPSKAMNIEARAKDHIKTLQRVIKTKITIDVEVKVSGNPFGTSLIVPTRLSQLTVESLVAIVRSLFSAKARKQKLTLAENLFKDGASIERTTNNVLSLLIGASVELSQCEFPIFPINENG